MYFRCHSRFPSVAPPPPTAHRPPPTTRTHGTYHLHGHPLSPSPSHPLARSHSRSPETLFPSFQGGRTVRLKSLNPSAQPLHRTTAEIRGTGTGSGGGGLELCNSVVSFSGSSGASARTSGVPAAALVDGRTGGGRGGWGQGRDEGAGERKNRWMDGLCFL
ncbi:hypothetical protein BZA05DRAFT_161709 [Tricharina praecox]|uniref:uncharacterized protein n=1 Tax=Tricharina praecox TaxID=43433 RepID=UPI00221EBE91|nr:uncharacterized protein BZA05DRAFT_161709 [Tricharina praecox]KAI5856915.1 hypothetical protein BZA05DRAFT_161709 [Tricharina praecox]